MPERRHRGRELRALWATLAVICLLAAGVAYGATRYLQSELEADATQDARKLTTEVLQPLLSAKDVETPVRGERYDQLLASVQERVLAGPITGIRVWAQDGTILFADERGVVGEQDGKMRQDLLAAVAGRSRSVVEDGEFRTLTSMRVGEPPSLVMAELIRSHDAIVERSREQWYPWVGRALTAAAILAALWIVTAIAVWGLGIVRAREAERRRDEAIAPPVIPGRPAHDEDVPPYMRPGFREEVETRRRAEIEGIAADT